MKTLLLTLLILFSGLMLKAQVQVPYQGKLLKPIVAKPFMYSGTNATSVSRSITDTSSEVLLDYGNIDYTLSSPNFAYFTFPLNARYTLAQSKADTTGLLMNYGVVGFDTLVDSRTLTATAKNTVSGILVDTIYFGLSHVNHSSTNDTLILTLVPLTSGYPNVAATPYASDTIITDSSLSNSVDTLATFFWTPNIAIAANGFGVLENYYGPLEDTFYLWSGDPYFISTTCTFNGAYANQSAYYPNSYAYWALLSALVPTASGQDEFYPCTNDKVYTPGVDGADYIQDIAFDASVRLLQPTGIQNLSSNLNLKSISPNPASQSANVYLGLTNNSNVIINLVDLMGRTVKSYNEGTQSTGVHQYQLDLSNVASGSYIINVVGDNGSKAFGKLVVIN